MSKKNRQNKCKLCHVKRKKWIENGFFGITCMIKNKPMIVVERHTCDLTEDELKLADELGKKYYPHLRPKDVCAEDLNNHWFRYYI